MNTPDYYVVGHDTPESLCDSALSASPRQRLSFLFGGIGDARNLFQTIIEVAAHERDSKRKETYKDYHFTIVDIKSVTIARNLVILMLLDELSKLVHDTARAKSSKILLCIFYTHLSLIMPNSLLEVLQRKIGEARTAPEKGTLPLFIDILDTCRAEIVGYLDDWQRKVQQEFPVTRLRCRIVRMRELSELESSIYDQPSDSVRLKPGGIAEREQRFEHKTGAFVPFAPYNGLLDPGLREAFDDFVSRESESAVRKAVRSIDDGWSTNPTFVDLAWVRKVPNRDLHIDPGPCNFTDDIWERMWDNGFRPSQLSLFEHPAHWFLSIAQALKQMRGRIKIEARVGDVTTVLEQIKYGVVGHRERRNPSETHHQASYPEVYDRIHLSNVPDYIGGTLTSHLYALQLTHPEPTSYVTSSCLLNTSRFNSIAEFDAEYFALYSDKDLEKVFRTRLKLNDNLPKHPVGPYNQWYHLNVSSEYKDLMPRADLQTWLYRLFFKAILPFGERIITSRAPIHSPLNLTYLFRLCAHLHSIGYPAHWLSEVISNLLSGTVTTTARPPRTEPLKPSEIDATRKPMTQSVAPFTAELSTLVAMWQLLLTFCILSSYIAPVQTLKRYTLTFKKVSQEGINRPHFILVFYKDAPPSHSIHDVNIRSVLLSDEHGINEHGLEQFRDQRVNIFSTWAWHEESRTATFWLRGDEMQRMKDGGWKVCMFRTDNWRSQSSFYGIDKVKDTGVRWVDQVNGKV
jgi:hypothetical protein